MVVPGEKSRRNRRWYRQKRFKNPQITQITQISVLGEGSRWDLKEYAPEAERLHPANPARSPERNLRIFNLFICGSLLAELDDRQGTGLQRQSEIGRIFFNHVDTRGERLCSVATQFCLLFHSREIRASHRFPFF
jgi:hypothetical protein